MKSILVGYDDSEGAQRALRWAVELAKPFGARVRVASVAHAVAPMVRSGGIGLVGVTDTVADHEAELMKARAWLEEHGVEADYEVAVGDPADTLVTLARERGVDLIVVGTHEPRLFERMLEGSVSQSVARRARVPVLVVH